MHPHVPLSPLLVCMPQTTSYYFLLHFISIFAHNEKGLLDGRHLWLTPTLGDMDGHSLAPHLLRCRPPSANNARFSLPMPSRVLFTCNGIATAYRVLGAPPLAPARKL